LNLYDGSILTTTGALNIFNTDDSQDLIPSKIIHKFKNGNKFTSLLGQIIRKVNTLDEIFKTKDTPLRYIRAVVKPVLKSGKVYKVLGVCQDVSEPIVKEKSLRLFKEIIDIDKSNDL